MKALVLLISGKQGSGKTTLGRAIAKRAVADDGLEFRMMKFADPLYEMHGAIMEVLEEYGHPVDHGKVDGKLLQLLGTEWGRNHVDPELWSNLLMNRVQGLVRHAHPNRPLLVIVDDARFENEIGLFDYNPNRIGTFKVRLDAPEGIRQGRAEKWRTNTEHPLRGGPG